MGPHCPGNQLGLSSMARAKDQATPEGFAGARLSSPPVGDVEGFAVVPGSILLLSREVD